MMPEPGPPAAPSPLVLGIETSCDETAAAVVAHGRVVLSSVVASQGALHAPYGGVFPEVASRQHIRDIGPVVRRALAEAGVGLDDVACVAVTYGPGLAGSLLVGLNAAKGLALARGLPLVGVNHMHGHLYSNWLHVGGRMRRADGGGDGDGGGAGGGAGVGGTAPPGAGDDAWPGDPPFPHLLLTVSGGHTELVHVRGHGDFRLLGATLDDAAGEAFDKAARMLGLGYPGGPAIERAAAGGDAAAVRFPVADTAAPLDFSFSGLKTALRREVEAHTARGAAVPVADVAAAFQAAVVRALVGRVRRALASVAAEAVLVAGGVAANGALRAALAEAVDRPVRVPPPALCTDNAAMIAAAGYFAFRAGRRDGLDLDVAPGLALG